MRTKFLYTLSVVMALLIGGVLALTYSYYFPLKNSETKIINEVKIEEEGSLKYAIKESYDAVVLLETNVRGRQTGSGTGFVYKIDEKQGYILTNHHVINNGNQIKATLSNGKEVLVEVLGSDEMLDLAVLAIKKEDVLKVAQLGTTDEIELGDNVFTIGSPLGKEYMGTVTKGILSGKDRTITVSLSNGDFVMEVLQTDAAINPGNSGGPLLNAKGQVIGINSLKLVKDEIEGMGFAIPIDLAKSFLPRLEKGEKIERPVIGLSLIEVTNTYGLLLSGISVNDPNITDGVVVAKIEDNSPVAKTEIKVGDVITEVNSIKTKDLAHFRFNLYKYKAGDTITITYINQGQEKTARVTLAQNS